MGRTEACIVHEELSAADPATILDNMPLIEGLELTKATSKEISEQVEVAKDTEQKINLSRELYRPAAAEGSMLFFLIIQLCVVEHMYQYSLDAFVTFLYKAIDKAPTDDNTEVRCSHLVTTIRMVIFRMVNRGLGIQFLQYDDDITCESHCVSLKRSNFGLWTRARDLYSLR